jgi:ornithine cyclodeaminase/alanine dehydrogenase-like protein (mu-crystallin family)
VRTPTDVLVIGAAEVHRLVSMVECIEIIRHTMRCVSRGGAQLPLRVGAVLPGTAGVIAAMPGYLSEPPSAGAKLIAVLPANSQRGLPSHSGVVVLFDPDEGTPFAIVEAGAITSLRTAAASAVATSVLARGDAAELAVLGTGEQAAAHVRALALVRDLRAIRVWGRSVENAQRFVERHAGDIGIAMEVHVCAEEAVRTAAIVCTTTSSREPILSGGWIGRGTHVNLVGASSATAREADDELVARSRFFVDYRVSALAQAGELLDAMGSRAPAHIAGEIGEVLNGTVPGRVSGDQVTVYKSLGIAAQDLAVAKAVFDKAIAAGLGTRVQL